MTMRCAKCDAENREGAKFCNECAAPMPAKCARCGAVNHPSARFCDECAAPLDAAPRAGAANPSPITGDPGPSVRITPEQPGGDPLDGERKTVTALFVDIKGSTELMAELDPEEARAIIDPALKLMIDAVHRYDGYIVLRCYSLTPFSSGMINGHYCAGAIPWENLAEVGVVKRQMTKCLGFRLRDPRDFLNSRNQLTDEQTRKHVALNKTSVGSVTRFLSDLSGRFIGYTKLPQQIG